MGIRRFKVMNFTLWAKGFSLIEVLYDFPRVFLMASRAFLTPSHAFLMDSRGFMMDSYHFRILSLSIQVTRKILSIFRPFASSSTNLSSHLTCCVNGFVISSTR